MDRGSLPLNESPFKVFMILSIVLACVSMDLAWFAFFRRGPRLYQKGLSPSCFCISRCLLFHSFVYGAGFFFMVLFMALACCSFSCLRWCLGFVIVSSIVWHISTVLSMICPWCSSLFCLWRWLFPIGFELIPNGFWKDSPWIQKGFHLDVEWVCNGF